MLNMKMASSSHCQWLALVSSSWCVGAGGGLSDWTGVRRVRSRGSAACAGGLQDDSRLASTSQSKGVHHTFDSTKGLFGLMGEVGPWVRESRESWRYMLSW